MVSYSVINMERMAFDIIQKPSLSILLGFLVAIAYIPGIIGASIPTSWFVLIITMPILMIFCEFKLNLVNLLGIIFIGFNVLSLLWAPSLNISFFFLLQLVTLSCVFCFGLNLLDIRPIFKGLALGLGVSSLVAIFQYYGFKPVFTIGNDIAGLFVNPNIYSEVSAVMLVGLIVLKLWYCIPVTLPGLILIHSRTALMGLAAGLFCYFYSKNKLLALASVLIVGMLGVIFFINSFSIMSIQERFDIWQDTLRGVTFFGNGVGSYEILYPLNAIHVDTSVARPKFAHNDLLQVIFENGIFALPLIAIIVLIPFNPILITLGIMSLLTYSLRVPMEIFIACIVAGYITRGHVTNWNFGDSCRSIVFTWFKNWRNGVCKIS